MLECIKQWNSFEFQCHFRHLNIRSHNSLEKPRSVFRLLQSLWYFTGVSVARCRNTIQVSKRLNVSTEIRSRDFAISDVDASQRILGSILDMGSAIERLCYTVTTSLIGWAHTQNAPWNLTLLIRIAWQAHGIVDVNMLMMLSAP